LRSIPRQFPDLPDRGCKPCGCARLVRRRSRRSWNRPSGSPVARNRARVGRRRAHLRHTGISARRAGAPMAGPGRRGSHGERRAAARVSLGVLHQERSRPVIRGVRRVGPGSHGRSSHPAARAERRQRAPQRTAGARVETEVGPVGGVCRQGVDRVRLGRIEARRAAGGDGRRSADLATAAAVDVLEAERPDSASSEWSWWQRGGFDHVEQHDDRVVAAATRLPPGRHEFSYLVRATTAGTFSVAGARLEAMYAPEWMGRSEAVVVTVKEPTCRRWPARANVCDII
jgi:hypothetical protein